ncbi:helicase [Theileria orientalis]|uniref:Helicase n=1 Tax=Theileria orientalis TaxID=68886 RepID=A0A976M7K6_THEOR|nr:helicase [Theileria orientalis]
MSKTQDSINNISGIDVKFPYQPYEQQKSFMESVIKAIQDSKNALLESPTGTGKTLSLICASLACILSNRTNKILGGKTYEEEKKVNQDDILVSQLISLKGAIEKDMKKPKSILSNKMNIIYTSRTHSQLKQVINEVKKSSYSKEFHQKGLKAALLASRDLLCINPAKGNLSGDHLNNFCRLLIQNRKCIYHNTLRGSKNSEDVQFTELVDIEDMVDIGKRGAFCPYFAVKDAQENADLILVPYNYLLSPSVREAMDLKTKNSIVIIDEAHNVESVAEEASSFFVKQTDIAKFIEALKRFATFHKDALTSKDNEKVEEVIINFTPLSQLGICLSKTDEFLTSVTLMDSRDPRNQKMTRDNVGIRWSVKEIGRQHVVYSADSIVKYLYNNLEYKSLKEAKVDDSITQVVNLLTKGFLDSEAIDVGFLDHYDNKTLREDVLTFVQMKKFVSSILSQELFDFPEYYEVIVTNDERFENPKRQRSIESNVYGWNRKFITRDQEEEDEQPEYRYEVTPKIMNFSCLQPIPTFIRIKREGLRSLILTSGTLGPLDVLERHIGGNYLKFEIKLQNSHVIDPKRVWAGVITGNDEDPNILSSAFNKRGDLNYITALGRALYGFIKSVPSGVLVFFGSYIVMNNTLSVWKRLGLYSKMEMVKSIFVENRPPSFARDNDIIPESTQALFTRYKDNIDNGKASMFFAICRGRMAEGIDFSDDYCRGIFLCGIPYPSRYEDTTALKMDYLDKLSVTTAEKANLSHDWYTTQAIKAINQAIGRSIRHIEDYGAIMLADYRFRFPAVKSSISKWVLERLKIYTKIEDCMDELDSFFAKFEATKKEKPRVVKNEPEKPEREFVPIMLDNSLQFKSRDTSKNSKLKDMPFYKFNADTKNMQQQYGNSIINYLAKPNKPRLTKQRATDVKQGGLSFKTVKDWNFS